MLNKTIINNLSRDQADAIMDALAGVSDIVAWCRMEDGMAFAVEIAPAPVMRARAPAGDHPNETPATIRQEYHLENRMQADGTKSCIEHRAGWWLWAGECWEFVADSGTRTSTGRSM